MMASGESRNHIHVVVEGQPKAKQRARMGRRGAYTPSATTNGQEVVGWALKQAVGHKMFPSNVYVKAVFYRSNRQRIDVDNLLKLVLDAATGICWVDDSQVTSVQGELELDAANPRTEIEIGVHESTMLRGDASYLSGTCPTCHTDFAYRVYESKPKRQIYCSKSCNTRGSATCPECSKEFVKRANRQVFCSKACAATSKATRAKIANARRRAAAPKNTCADCGKVLVQRTAALCRDCWLTGPKDRRRKQFGDRTDQGAAAA